MRLVVVTVLGLFVLALPAQAQAPPKTLAEAKQRIYFLEKAVAFWQAQTRKAELRAWKAETALWQCQTQQP